LRSIVVVLLLSLSAAVSADDPFPLPDELVPDVEFWIDVFTEYTTEQGVLHDNRQLGIVYERIDLPSDASARTRRKLISDRRKAIRESLERLAASAATTADDARIRGLFPAGATAADFRAAAGRIRFQQGLSDRFRDGLIRAGRWRSYIEDTLGARGVPVDLVALPHVESSYNPNARSNVGASGIWQFTRSTGRRFMRVDHIVDERNDIYPATDAAARLLAYNYSITGSWPMAITAYNHGLASVRRAMREFGDDALVDILRRYDGRTFGFASRNFYVAFLAAREVDQNVERYFPGLKADSSLDYDEARLDRYLPVESLADALEIRPTELARHNPAWQPTIWQGSKHIPKDAVVRIPHGAATTALAAALTGNIGWADEQLPDLFHRVSRGDTLSQIAETYKTRVSTLVALNNLNSRHRIRIGDRLRLPAAGPAPVAAAVEEAVLTAQETVAPPAPAALTDVDDRAEPAALLSDPNDYSVDARVSIEVHPQETLGHYADWLGIRTQILRDLNGLAFRTPVVVGQRLTLPPATDIDDFERRRVDYHRTLQNAFFSEHRIEAVRDHRIRRGESIWLLALQRYDVPVWLFRQYNPDVKPETVRPGTVVRFPILADTG